jgi:hypothetical protein
MNAADARRHRFFNHGLAHLASASPAEVVTWFGAMQAQDYASARWAPGVRSPALSDVQVEQAIDARSIVRVWSLRSTLHLIAAADVHWLLGLVGPAMLARSAAMYRPLGLEEAGFAPVRDALEEILQGRQLLREELFAALEARGIDTGGQRGSRILYRAGLSSCICAASLRGRQTTFALLDEWLASIPRSRFADRDQALGELALRYFRSHGPASLRDFTWWSGLGAHDARRALVIAKPVLCQTQIDGQDAWYVEMPVTPTAHAPRAHLLPAFDEYFLGYADRSLALPATHFSRVMTNNGIFRPAVLLDGEIVGVWARSFSRGRVAITHELFRPMDTAAEQAIVVAAQRYAAFVDMPCDFMGQAL